MRRWLAVLLVLLVLTPFPASAVAVQPVRILVNGRQLSSDVPPTIVDGRVLLPLRALADALHVDVHWLESCRTVVLGRLTSPGAPATESPFCPGGWTGETAQPMRLKAVSQKVLLAGSYAGGRATIQALHPESLKPLWQSEASSLEQWRGSIADGVAYWPAADAILAAEAETGRVIWSVPAPMVPAAALAGPHGVLASLSGDHSLVSLEPSTGQVRWRYTGGGHAWIAPESITHGAGTVALTLYRVAQGAVRSAPHLVVLNGRTGQVLWERPLTASDAGVVPVPVHGPTGLWLVRDGGQHVLALDEYTGSVRWQYMTAAPVSGAVGPALQVTGGVVAFTELQREAFTPEQTATVVAVGEADGQLRWRAPVRANPDTALYQVGDRLAVGYGPEGRALLISPADGSLPHGHRTGPILRASAASPIWEGGRLHVSAGPRLEQYRLGGSTAEIRVIVGGLPLQTDVAPRIVDDRTLVPVRAIAEALGLNVEWDEPTRTVRLTGRP